VEENFFHRKNPTINVETISPYSPRYARSMTLVSFPRLGAWGAAITAKLMYTCGTFTFLVPLLREPDYVSRATFVILLISTMKMRQDAEISKGP